ncbi:MAG: DNA repair protein RecO [Minisyncoccia bacterium]
MSYHIYTTRGIVLGERPAREADRVYTIFTKDLGLVRASATGVRKDLSKLRGHLEPFSLATVSLVRGREYWRLTSAELVYNLETRLSETPELFLAFAKNFSLLEKLVAGEEKHLELFEDIAAVAELIVEGNIPALDPESVEILLAARILFNLGYLSAEEEFGPLLEGNLTAETLKAVSESKKSLIKAINQGIQSSQLGS